MEKINKEEYYKIISLQTKPYYFELWLKNKDNFFLERNDKKKVVIVTSNPKIFASSIIVPDVLKYKVNKGQVLLKLVNKNSELEPKYYKLKNTDVEYRNIDQFELWRD